MSTFKLVRNTLCGIKSETTQGTPATVTTSDFAVLTDAKYTPKISTYKRNVYTGTLDTLPDVITSQAADVELTMEMFGSGSLGNPYFQALAKATMTASASYTSGVVSIDPISVAPAGMESPATSLTVNVYQDGIKNIATGVVGTSKIAIEVSKPALATFSLKGVYTAHTDTANPVPVGLSTIAPPVCQGIGLTVGSYAPIGVQKVDIDFGIGVQELTDANATSGIHGYFITGRAPVLSFDYIVDTLANHDAVASMIAGTQFAVTATVGTVTGNKIVFTFPAVQITDVTTADKNGILTYNVKAKCVGTGNNSFKIELK